tara:strand:+ start:574 stop:900 length:327 start_codon:yes stop_codon:yes gene_type:complete
MNFELEKAWNGLFYSFHFDNIERPDVDSILFVVGLQELNFKTGKLNKDQKLDVIHICLFVVFIPYGYCELVGRDSEGWIHFKSVKKFPNLNAEDQEIMIKEVILDYYK